MINKLKNNKKSLGITFMVFLLLSFSVLFMGADTNKKMEQINQGIATLENIQTAFHLVAQKVIPTVVEVRVVDVVKAPAFQSPFDFFFNNPDDNSKPQEREFRQYGLGSGVIVERKGSKVYVLTNNHVADGASEITITLSDKREFKATLVGSDDKRDLALLVFETKDQVPIAELGDSNNIQVGDWVLAIGNPLGFASSITSGIISALGRENNFGSASGGFTEYIQTDAAINQGNSGGALVNIQGQVIGINTWIASPTGGNVGLGFAIPINNAKKDINDFIAKGKVEYGWLGITIGEVAPPLAEDLKIRGKDGAFVYSVFKDSPAFQAGVFPGDFITSLNGTEVKNSSQLLKLIGDLAPGSISRLAFIRDGKNQEITVKLVSRDNEKAITAKANKIWPGFSVLPLTADIRDTLKLKAETKGVAIVELDQGSAASVAGLKQGDVITSINDKKITTASDFYRYLNEERNRDIRFRIIRENTELVIGLIH
jgi:Do/DeqQ family serine protease